MATKITRKDFIEQYTTFFQNAAKDELVAILSAMAEKVEPSARQSFLNTLYSPQQKRSSVKSEQLEQGILDEIADIKSEILEKAEEEADWDEYQDDEDLAGYEEFVGSLARLMCKVNAKFDLGCYEFARKAYAELFTIDVEDEYGHGINISDVDGVDLNEARARYLRSIYLTTRPNVRVKVLLDAMLKLDKLDFNERQKLNDMVAISVESLPDFSRFLEQWIAATQDYSKPQYDAWNREATMLLYGSAGLEDLAKKEGKKRPRVYLAWINALIAEKNYNAALQAIEVALKELQPDQPIRAAIGDLIVVCGKKLNDNTMQFAGLWHSFAAKPRLDKLIDLYERCDVKDLLPCMCKAAEIIAVSINRADQYKYEPSWEKDDATTPSWPNASLLLHAYFFSKQINKAFKLAKQGELLGWSSNDNPQAFFVAYILVAAAKKPLGKLPSVLREFWDYALDISLGWYYPGKDELRQKLEKIYQTLFLTAGQVDEKIITWCLTESENRITAIINGQYRGAYDRAALLAVACAKTLQLKDTAMATEFLTKIKNNFPRHSAFQSALRAAQTK